MLPTITCQCDLIMWNVLKCFRMWCSGGIATCAWIFEKCKMKNQRKLNLILSLAPNPKPDLFFWLGFFTGKLFSRKVLLKGVFCKVFPLIYVRKVFAHATQYYWHCHAICFNLRKLVFLGCFVNRLVSGTSTYYGIVFCEVIKYC